MGQTHGVGDGHDDDDGGELFLFLCLRLILISFLSPSLAHVTNIFNTIISETRCGVQQQNSRLGDLHGGE